MWTSRLRLPGVAMEPREKRGQAQYIRLSPRRLSTFTRMFHQGAVVSPITFGFGTLLAVYGRQCLTTWAGPHSRVPPGSGGSQ